MKGPIIQYIMIIWAIEQRGGTKGTGPLKHNMYCKKNVFGREVEM